MTMNREQFQKGMEVRREVMGDEFVDRAMSNAGDFARPLQEMVTANCWGEVWTREVLSRETRSLITIAILVALRVPAELKGHVRGALRNGCSKEEIREVLLHATVYCDIPAGIEAFRAASEIIEQCDD